MIPSRATSASRSICPATVNTCQPHGIRPFLMIPLLGLLLTEAGPAGAVFAQEPDRGTVVVEAGNLFGNDAGGLANMAADPAANHPGPAIQSPATLPDWHTRPGFQKDELLNEFLRTTVVEEWFYDQVSFSDFTADFLDRYGLSLRLHDSAIDDSLQMDTSIACQIRNQNLETALSTLLERHNAVFIVREGEIIPISCDFADDPDFFETRIFPVEGLTENLPQTLPSRYAPSPETPPVVGAALQRELPMIQAGALQPAPPRRVAPPHLTVLEQLVVEFVEPDAWSVSGLGDANLRQAGDRLIVTGSRRCLNRTRDFLLQLQASCQQ